MHKVRLAAAHHGFVRAAQDREPRRVVVHGVLDLILLLRRRHSVYICIFIHISYITSLLGSTMPPLLRSVIFFFCRADTTAPGVLTQNSGSKKEHLFPFCVALCASHCATHPLGKNRNSN